MKLDIEKMHVMYDNVLIKATLITEVDGVITPQDYESKTFLGEVLKIGDGRLLDTGKLLPLRIKVGDTILFNQYTATKFRSGSDEYFIIKEEDIVAYQR